MGSQRSTGQSDTGDAGSLSLINSLMAGLFGVESHISDEGLVTLGAPSKKDKGSGPLNLANQVFDPTSFENVGDFTTFQNPFLGASLGLGAEAVSGTAQGLETLSDFATPALRGLLTDGNPVDTSALVQQSLADTAERFQGITGSFSSDLGAAATRDASQLRVGAEESARQRQLQSLGLAGGLAQAQGQIPANLASNLLNLGEEQFLTGTPGGREFAFLQQLQGLVPTGATSRGTSQKSKSAGGSV